MGKNIDNIKVAKLVKLLTGDNKISQIANVIDKVQIKDYEQIREIVPCKRWLYEDYAYHSNYYLL